MRISGRSNAIDTKIFNKIKRNNQLRRAGKTERKNLHIVFNSDEVLACYGKVPVKIYNLFTANRRW
jgi:hypothetical protein